ncbi:MAG: hypothetical protein GY765_12995 [bacterium]|nr:hypothetical protein [bacterium]
MLYMALHSKETREYKTRVGYSDTDIHEVKGMLNEVAEELRDLRSLWIDSKCKTREYKELRAKAHMHYPRMVHQARGLFHKEPATLGFQGAPPFGPPEGKPIPRGGPPEAKTELPGEGKKILTESGGTW